jgi:antitoxin component of RelBE/YafQ-DinJ toxin-antitoxin module
MTKSSALRIRVDPELHREFLDVCKRMDVPAAQVLRQYMRKFVDENGEDGQQVLFDLNDKLKT